MKKTIVILIMFALGLSSCGEKLEEKVITTHPNKTPSLVEFYRNVEGKSELAKVVRYYINGEKKEEVLMSGNKKNGTLTVWYANGEKAKVETYKDDMLNGKCEYWNENGVLTYEAYYTEGKPSGVWKFFDEEGALQNQQSYE